ncbi:MAG: hypothetical protein Q7R95_08295 [bacterium]|nr:hypothetical protein [bacterium]
MSNLILLIVSIICLLLVLLLYIYTPMYIQKEGTKAGLDEETINKWKTKAILFGCLFVLILFKRYISKLQKDQ